MLSVKVKVKVAILVYNFCIHDARVIKTAEAMSDRGFDVRVFARNNGEQLVNEFRNGVAYSRNLADRDKLVSYRPATLFDKNKSESLNLRILEKFLRLFSKPILLIYLIFAFFLQYRIVKWVVREILVKCILLLKNIFRKQKSRIGRLSKGLVRFFLRRSPHLAETRKSFHFEPVERHFYDDLITFNPDIIHVNDLQPLQVGVKVSKRLNVPIIYDVHEFESGRQDNAFSSMTSADIAAIEVECSKYISGAVTVSDRLAQFYKELLGFSPLTVLNTPRLKPSFFREEGVRKAIGAKCNEVICIYPGILAKNRGIEGIVNVLPEFSNLHFVCVGPNNPKNVKYFNEIAEKLGVVKQFSILDAVPFDAVSSFISSADFGVIPAIGNLPNQEAGAPNKLFEMLFAGLPILAADIMQRRTLIEQFGRGVFFPNKPDIRFDKYIKNIISISNNSKEKRQELAITAYDKIGWDTQMDIVEKIYHESILSYKK